jgi:hypothetical protein
MIAFIKNQFESLPRRWLACLEAAGGATKYLIKSFSTKLCMKESLKKLFSMKIYCLKVLNLCMYGSPIWTCFLARVLGS